MARRERKTRTIPAMPPAMAPRCPVPSLARPLSGPIWNRGHAGTWGDNTRKRNDPITARRWCRRYQYSMSGPRFGIPQSSLQVTRSLPFLATKDWPTLMWRSRAWSGSDLPIRTPGPAAMSNCQPPV